MIRDVHPPITTTNSSRIPWLICTFEDFLMIFNLLTDRISAYLPKPNSAANKSTRHVLIKLFTHHPHILSNHQKTKSDNRLSHTQHFGKILSHHHNNTHRINQCASNCIFLYFNFIMTSSKFCIRSYYN